ncbi:hopanoid biosynthesis associated RND transporter like HpnN domain protein [Burkholderia mallei]|nr:hopanoid biosynthesis associated RND transporter like HpnN domain protein [Burkholderia mallei]
MACRRERIGASRGLGAPISMHRPRRHAFPVAVATKTYRPGFRARVFAPSRSASPSHSHPISQQSGWIHAYRNPADSETRAPVYLDTLPFRSPQPAASC